MGDRYWLWLGARLLVAFVIIGWAVSYLHGGSEEKDFQQTLDAMKQVHSFRVVSSDGTTPQHRQMFWEVDCERGIVHDNWSVNDDTRDPHEIMRHEAISIGTNVYDRKSDGSWSGAHFGAGGSSAEFLCQQLAQGQDTNVLPQIATMIRRGIIQKGDKKTVNGVRCREYLVTLKGGSNGLEHDTVCIGLADHLPYEMTVDWLHSRESFSDYNTRISFNLPEVALQNTSATSN